MTVGHHRTWDVQECYEVHKAISVEFWGEGNYREYIETMANLGACRKWVPMRNRFPYDVPCRQTVVWSRDGTLPTREEAERLCNHGVKSRRFFVNPPSLRSVPSVAHCHVWS